MRHAACCARPVGSVVPEYAGRRRDRRLGIQRAGGNYSDAEIGRNSGHWTATGFAENIPKSFCVRHLETEQFRFAGGPFGVVGLEYDVAGVACAVCFTTALAMTVKKVEWRSGYQVLNPST